MKPKKMVHRICLLIVFLNFQLLSQSTDDLPQRIMLNLTSKPSTSMAVTWRTCPEHQTSAVQYAIATDWTEFEKFII